MMAVKPWNPFIEQPNEAEARAAELTKLRLYLKYLVENDTYVSLKLNAEVALQEKREDHIKKQLQLYDNMALLSAENKTWGWSPLFNILARQDLRGIPDRPWSHTAEELEHIISVLEKEATSDPMSLELECPHIVRALKLYTRLSVAGRTRPLAHPVIGMTRKTLRTIANQKTESQRLASCAQEIVDIGWSLFPCIKVGFCEPLSRCWSDMVGLMAFEGWNQEPVLDKIDNFLCRVARRAVLDMHRTGDYSDELSAMWWSPGPIDPEILRQHCEEVCILMQFGFLCYSKSRSPQFLNRQVLFGYDRLRLKCCTCVKT
jgi:hypothetical protein